MMDEPGGFEVTIQVLIELCLFGFGFAAVALYFAGWPGEYLVAGCVCVVGGAVAWRLDCIAEQIGKD